MCVYICIYKHRFRLNKLTLNNKDAYRMYVIMIEIVIVVKIKFFDYYF